MSQRFDESRKSMMASSMQEKQPVIIFCHKQYPFLNSVNSYVTAFKTILNCNLTAARLQRLVQLSHRNLVGLKKIVRNNKNAVDMNLLTYSFYYEVIPYSLRNVVNSPTKYVSVYQRLISYDISKMIKTFLDYLLSMEVIYVIRLQDIGVDTDGHLHIYISPSVTLEALQYNSTGKEMVQKAYQKLMAWFETSLAANASLPAINIIHSGYNLQLNKSLCQLLPAEKKNGANNKTILREQEEQQSVVSKIYVPNCRTVKSRNMSQSSNYNDFTSQLPKDQVKPSPKVSSNMKQSQKIKMIDQQLREIRSKIELKSSLMKSTINSSATHTKNGFLFSSLQHNDVTEYAKQSHVTAQLKPYVVPQPSPKIQQKQSNNKFMSASKQLQSHKVYTNDQQLQQHSEDCSLGTYEGEIDAQFKMPKVRINCTLRQTLHPTDRKNIPQVDTGKSKRQAENIVAKKNVSQSAGPAQFKNFHMKLLKPEFRAKKSNIYEDPGEYESDGSGEKSKRLQARETQIFSTHTSSAQNSARRKINTMNIESIVDQTHRGLLQQKQNQMQKDKQAQQQQLKQQTIKELKQQHQRKKISRMDSKDTLQAHLNYSKPNPQTPMQSSRQAKDSVIEEKVKAALQKTKKAIAQLKKVKQAKISRRNSKQK